MLRAIFITLILACGINLNAQTTTCSPDTISCYTTKKFDSDFEIQLERKWRSRNYAFVFSTPLIFDIDGDCLPEIIIPGEVTQNDASNEIIIMNSSDGSTIKVLKLPFRFSANRIAFAILKHKDEISIIVAAEKYNPFEYANRLISLDLDGNINWISDSPYNPSLQLMGPNLNLADFNQDGIPEVFVSNLIYNALTGKMLADGGTNGTGGDLKKLPLAMDIDNDPSDLELIAGPTIYKVIINNPDGIDGNSMIPHNFLFDGEFREGEILVADINGDGFSDIVVLSYGWPRTEFSNTVVYVYSFINGQSELLASQQWPGYKKMSLGALGQINDSKEN